MEVKQQMTRQVAFVTPEDTISDAYSAMRSLEMHHLPVLENSKLVGMLSDRDILIRARRENDEMIVPGTFVKEVMSAPVLSCAPDVSVGHAADLMLKNQVHSVPVVDARGKLVGIVTSSDLLRLLRDREWALTEPLPFSFPQPVWWRSLHRAV